MPDVSTKGSKATSGIPNERKYLFRNTIPCPFVTWKRPAQMSTMDYANADGRLTLDNWKCNPSMILIRKRRGGWLLFPRDAPAYLHRPSLSRSRPSALSLSLHPSSFRRFMFLRYATPLGYSFDPNFTPSLFFPRSIDQCPFRDREIGMKINGSRERLGAVIGTTS